MRSKNFYVKGLLLLIVVLITALGWMIFQSNSPTEDVKERALLMQHYRIYPVPIPKNVNFAGENVPVDDFEVRERLDRELLVNTYWQSSTLLVLKRSKRAFMVIEPILKQYGVPDDFKYLAAVESGLDEVVSGSGAAGVWQFMKATAQSYGLEVSDNADERYHLEKATHAACKYLVHAHQTLGSWAMAAASYNRGLQGVVNARNAQRQSNFYNLYLNSETSRYVLRMVAMKLIMENPRYYGFQFKPQDAYNTVETYEITVDSNVKSLPELAIKYHTTYKILRELNPWLTGYELKAGSDKKYTLLVPSLLAEGAIEQK